jgi:hypothetical protein
LIALTGLNFEIRVSLYQFEKKGNPVMPTSSIGPSQDRQRLVRSFSTDAIKRQVADHPMRSALLAVAAGALAMLLIRTQLTKRAKIRKWDWMRMR